MYRSSLVDCIMCWSSIVDIMIETIVEFVGTVVSIGFRDSNGGATYQEDNFNHFVLCEL